MPVKKKKDGEEKGGEKEADTESLAFVVDVSAQAYYFAGDL